MGGARPTSLGHKWMNLAHGDPQSADQARFFLVPSGLAAPLPETCDLTVPSSHDHRCGQVTRRGGRPADKTRQNDRGIRGCSLLLVADSVTKVTSMASSMGSLPMF